VSTSAASAGGGPLACTTDHGGFRGEGPAREVVHEIVSLRWPSGAKDHGADVVEATRSSLRADLDGHLAVFRASYLTPPLSPSFLATYHPLQLIEEVERFAPADAAPLRAELAAVLTRAAECTPSPQAAFILRAKLDELRQTTRIIGRCGTKWPTLEGTPGQNKVISMILNANWGAADDHIGPQAAARIRADLAADVPGIVAAFEQTFLDGSVSPHALAVFELPNMVHELMKISPATAQVVHARDASVLQTGIACATDPIDRHEIVTSAAGLLPP
jgi:hypothetical protein